VSQDSAMQAYKRGVITFGQSFVQFLCKIGFLSVTEAVSVFWGWRTEWQSH